MTRYLPWLLVVACPLMMFFMMRGMGGGKNTDQDMPVKKTDDRDERSDLDHSASTTSAEDRARIAHLERENADLRAARDHPSGSTRTNRRWTL